MAIKTETFEVNGRHFVRTWSDENRYVVGGNPYGEYEEGLDPAEFGRTYTEGNLMTDEEIESNAQEILNIIMGVSE